MRYHGLPPYDVGAVEIRKLPVLCLNESIYNKLCRLSAMRKGGFELSSELSKVSPGQIISSDLMNAIIDRLVLLQGKVETLESEFAELNKLTHH